MTRHVTSPARLLVALGLSTTLLLTSGHAVSGPNGHAAINALSTPAAERAAASDATSDFINAHKQWAQARGASNKAATLQKLIAKAEARREMLAELIKTNPAEALRVAIPEEKQVGMPVEVLELLEQRFEVEGTLETHFEEYADGSHKLRHFVKTAFGEKFELHVANNAQEVLSGKQVRVNGLLLDVANEDVSSEGAIAVPDEEDSILWLALGGDPDGGINGAGSESDYGLPGTASDVTPTKGEQRTAVILVNFQDDPNNKPYSHDQLRNSMSQVDAFYQEASYQKTWFNTDVMGYYTISYSSSNCQSEEWQQAAIAAAGKQYDMSGYFRYVLIFPSNSCSWSGAGTVGRNPSITHLNGTPDPASIAHELGHNMGLWHSNALKCGTKKVGVLGQDCTSQEYGDLADTMGGAFAHFNAHQKERLAWLDASNIIQVEADGTYTIAPYELADTQPKALKIYKGIDPAWGSPTWYYAEYRQPIGFDTSVDYSWTGGNLYDGALIHYGYENYGDVSYLLDMTPGTSSVFTDAALESGDSFSDSDAGVTLTTLSADSNGLTLSVQVGSSQGSCVPAQPSQSFSPAQGPWVAAGTAVNYTVTVTNNDSSACSNSSFSLGTQKPTGWSAAFSNGSLNLAPGASASTTLTVTSSSSALDGFYNIGVTTASGSYSANGIVTYVVDNPITNTNSAPLAYNDSTTTDTGIPVTISVLANDSDPDGDALTVTSTSGVNGTVVMNGNGTITFTPASGFSGTETFSYSITDGNGGTASASVTVTVNTAPVDSNSTPVAVNDSATMPGVVEITIPALANDWDPEGDALTVTAVTQGAKGTVRINSDGSLTYTPGKRFKNADSFSYTISDGEKTAGATVSIQLQKSTGGNGGGKGNGKNR